MKKQQNSEETGIRGFWQRHKGVICTVGAVVGGVIAIGAAISAQNNTEASGLDTDGDDTEPGVKTDFGRDCLIVYSVEDTGEVLWKDRCYEAYVEDQKEWGSQYENIRQLNGLDAE